MKIRNRITELRYVRASTLIPNTRNWRRHPAAQADALRGALAEIGYADALIAYETGEGLVLIDGHLRAETTPDMEVPVLVTDLDEVEANKLLMTLDPLAAMASADTATFDALRQMTTVDSDALQEMLDAITGGNLKSLEAMQKPKVGLTDPDEVPPEPDEPWVQLGDLFQLGGHRILCGDSTQIVCVVRLMGGMVASSAIYDAEWDDAPTLDLPDDRLVFTDGMRCSDAITMHGLPRWVFVWDCVTSWYVAGQPLRRMKIALWYGRQPYNPDGSHYGEPGSRKVVTNTRGTYLYEPDQRGKHLSDIFQRPITREHSDGASHAKPVEWLAMLIGNCLPGGVVFDPFLGSGTTLIACEKLDRICYGMEIEPRYVQVAIERWENYTGQKAVKL